MNIILETPRLYLRELTPNDAQQLGRVLSNPDSMRFYPHPFSDEEVRQWIAHNIFRYQIYGFGLWAMVLKQENVFLGDCGITIQNIDIELLPEIGFHIIPEYSGIGYVTEAAREVLKYAAGKLPFHKVFAYCEKENQSSQNVMQRIGMSFYKSFIADGVDKVVYVIEL